MQDSCGTSPQGDGNGKSLAQAWFFSASQEAAPLLKPGDIAVTSTESLLKEHELVVQRHNGLSIVGAKLFCLMQQALSIPIKTALALSVCWRTMPKADHPKPSRRYRFSSITDCTAKMWQATQGSSNLAGNRAGAKPISAGFSPDVKLAPAHH